MSESVKLKILSQGTLDRLKNDVPENIDRYLGAGFADLAKIENGWGINISSVDVDLSLLEKINKLDQADLDENDLDRSGAKLLFKALRGMTPTLACQSRVWARLCHVELFDYSQRRWLDPIKTKGDEIVLGRIRDSKTPRFFSSTARSNKRDNAIGRLWWCGFLANIAKDSNSGDSFDRALMTIFPKQDIIIQYLDRTGITTSRNLLKGIIRKTENDDSLNDQFRFRRFMKLINREFSGQLVDLYSPSEVDLMLDKCLTLLNAQSQES